MQNASNIYRIGGDEFLVSYHKVEENTIIKEIQNLRETCKQESKNLPYEAAVSVGYARSNSNYKSLDDVIKTADYAMYQNKMELKANANAIQNLGTNLNYTGLMDRMFDIMNASNNFTYPFIQNLDTNVTRISKDWKEYFELDSEFYGNFFDVWKERIHPDYLEDYVNDIVSCLNGHQVYHHFDYPAKRADGEYVMVTCHGSLYVDKTSNIKYFTGYIINHGLDEKLDHVTGLNNFNVLNQDVYKCMDNGLKFSLLKLKITNFARINMLYSYAIGDEIIKSIAELLRKESKGKGEVYCQGSVNFTLLFVNNDKEFVENFYKNISKNLLSGIKSSSGLVPIQIAGGAYINNGTVNQIESIRSGLVYALEESNYNQRNNLVFYYDDVNNENDIALLSEIHANSVKDMSNFFLKYQPIIDMSTKKIIGTEALLRWKDEVRGEISPSCFISFLENDPCYYKIGLWIIEEAIKNTKELEDTIEDLTINVNITSLQLQHENFISDLESILKKYNFNSRKLTLELTERCKEMDKSFLKDKITSIRQTGIKIAFDDLETGYSTIGLLMDIPVDEIKLDREFVNDLQTNENYQIFAKALVLGSKTQQRNYNICFEGVENEEMFNFICEYGNFNAQGYYFAKPLLIEDLKEFIKNN